ncbi:hypothetical protein BFR81_07420 [Acinetobacter pittii]|nr:hypothetical protein BFR81_07420 [Acinetobacter pittii]
MHPTSSYSLPYGLLNLKFGNTIDLKYCVVFNSPKEEIVNFQNCLLNNMNPLFTKSRYFVMHSDYEELNYLYLQVMVQKNIGSFYGKGLNNHKYIIKKLRSRIAKCEANLQLSLLE